MSDSMPKKIILYGSPVCAMVPPVRGMLKRANAEFEYVNIYGDSQARAQVREINHGNESVPTLVFPDGSTLTEPSTGELKAKLESLGYETPPATWTQAIIENPITSLIGSILAVMGIINGDLVTIAIGVVVLAAGPLIGRLRDRT